MPYDFTYVWNFKNKTKQKQTHRYRQKTEYCQMGEGLGDWVKKMEEIKKYKLAVTNGLLDVKCSIRNVVSTIVVTAYGAR